MGLVNKLVNSGPALSLRMDTEKCGASDIDNDWISSRRDMCTLTVHLERCFVYVCLRPLRIRHSHVKDIIMH